MKYICIIFGLFLAPFLSLAQDLEIVAVVSRTEGPTVDRDGNVYFTEFFSQRIMMLDPAGILSTYRENSNVAVGLVIDDQNRLIAAEGASFVRDGNKVEGTPRLTRTDLKSGEVEVLADNYRGTAFSFLNDVTFDNEGRLYLTDFGSPAVYRVDGPSRIEQILGADDLERVNGIQISPGDATLYVAGANELRAYDLQYDGTVSNGRTHYQFDSGWDADGMSIDIEGNLYATVKPERGMSFGDETGIHVISADGELIQIMPIADSVTNVTFAGSDMRTLYVTAGNTLYRLRSDVPGLPR